MAITLKRTIWPVGHGAFYTEQWNDSTRNFFNVVYDCGSGQDKQCSIESNIANCIRHYSQEVKTIDALFISHLHHDHINGVDLLIANKNVQAIYLPQLTPNRILEALLFERIQGENTDVFENSVQFLRMVKEGTWNNIPVREIPEDNETDDTQESIGESSIGDSGIPIKVTAFRTANNHLRLLPEYIADKDINRELEHCCWIYKPFNPKIRISLEGGNARNYASLLELDFEALVEYIRSQEIEAVKSIYDDLFGKGNDYSMPIYSGFQEPILGPCYVVCRNLKNEKIVCPHRFFYPFVEDIREYNCLYMGDFESKNGNVEELIKYYSHQWRFIDLLQVPHHGSISNYNSKLYDRQKTCFISCDMRDRGLASHIEVEKKIRAQHCDLIFVTENPLSKLQYYYRFI